MKAKVYISPKKDILDPQGLTIERSLPALGFKGVTGVRVGKYIELEISDDSQAAEELEQMCQKLLANPIIEDYRFELVPE